MLQEDAAPAAGRKVVMTVFIALVLDLLAWYLHREAHSPSTLLSRLLNLSYRWRHSLVALSGSGATGVPGEETRWMWSAGTGGIEGGKNWDVVLLGGAMGSLFSFCQCFISPWLGALSDRYGRKKVLLATMTGNLLSAIIWLRSTTFASFVLSRLVGGLSEGNVQLSTAIISDVTTAATRSKSLALVGIAFSICFTLGPSLGAYFASRPIPMAVSDADDRWNVYALPAAISFGLLLVETIYLAARLPETKAWTKTEPEQKEGSPVVVKESVESRLGRLRTAGTLHGLFLLFFSGAEFTLTFLTYDLFAATNAQNGRLLSYIGILSAMLQARHVRPALARLGELRMASYGIFSCILALAFLSALPLDLISSDKLASTVVLYTAATCLAYTSATVVTSLTASAASCCDEEGGHPALQRGRALGGFRSRGQLGRAVGPLLASSVYWLAGPTVCYSLVAACMLGVWVTMSNSVREESARMSAQKAK